LLEDDDAHHVSDDLGGEFEWVDMDLTLFVFCMGERFLTQSSMRGSFGHPDGDIAPFEPGTDDRQEIMMPMSLAPSRGVNIFRPELHMVFRSLRKRSTLPFGVRQSILHESISIPMRMHRLLTGFSKRL
jgi:hypothetical protein